MLPNRGLQLGGRALLFAKFRIPHPAMFAAIGKIHNQPDDEPDN